MTTVSTYPAPPSPRVPGWEDPPGWRLTTARAAASPPPVPCAGEPGAGYHLCVTCPTIDGPAAVCLDLAHGAGTLVVGDTEAARLDTAALATLASQITAWVVCPGLRPAWGTLWAADGVWVEAGRPRRGEPDMLRWTLDDGPALAMPAVHALALAALAEGYARETAGGPAA